MQARSPSNYFGIDVSHHQGVIDWPKVKAAGAKFAFIKATEGKTGLDNRFISNASTASSLGIPVGYYHYAHPENNTAAEEVAYFLGVTKPASKPEFGYILDIEGPEPAKLGPVKLTQWCLDFLNGIKKAVPVGTNIMLYTGAYYAKSNLERELGAFPLWIAHYGVDKPMDNKVWPTWSVFQYSSSGKLNGITTAGLDINVMEKAFYEKFVNVTVTPIPPPPEKKTPFNDVPSGHWAEAAIKNMLDKQLIVGKTADTYGIDDPITREQLAVILDRFLKLKS